MDCPNCSDYIKSLERIRVDICNGQLNKAVATIETLVTKLGQ